MPTWTWTFEDADGRPVLPEAAGGPAAPEAGFPGQADAETWVGEHWRALVAAGAEGAVLSEGERRVYGPLALRPAE